MELVTLMTMPSFVRVSKACIPGTMPRSIIKVKDKDKGNTVLTKICTILNTFLLRLLRLLLRLRLPLLGIRSILSPLPPHPLPAIISLVRIRILSRIRQWVRLSLQ
jgi:hypothetical protein